MSSYLKVSVTLRVYMIECTKYSLEIRGNETVKVHRVSFQSFLLSYILLWMAGYQHLVLWHAVVACNRDHNQQQYIFLSILSLL